MAKTVETKGKKKKGEKMSLPDTATSAPLRGPNQDYSGVNVSNDVADYTISDGFIAGVGSVRGTPIQMNTTPRGKREKNAPRNIGAMQHAADRRRMQLDRIAQKRSASQKVAKEKAISKRQHAEEGVNMLNGMVAKTTDKEKKMKNFKLFREESNLPEQDYIHEIENEEIVAFDAETAEDNLDEARRGRPKKGEGEDQESSNIIMQLRKVISLRGQAPVRFLDGKQSMMSPATAHRLLSIYDNLKTSGEKHSFAERIHKSSDSLRDTLAGKKEVVKPKITLAGKMFR